MKTIDVTEADYAERLQKSTGLLLAHKPACPHCKNLKIVVEKFIKKQGPVDVLYLDTMANPQAMKALEIERVPTLLIVKEGEIRQRKAGLMNPRELAALYKQS
jgi:thioredoxin 1